MCARRVGVITQGVIAWIYRWRLRDKPAASDASPGATAQSFYQEAEFAGLVTPPAEVPAPVAPAAAPVRGDADPDALLVRFYSSQEC